MAKQKETLNENKNEVENQDTASNVATKEKEVSSKHEAKQESTSNSKGTGPINTLDAKDNPSELNPEKQIQEKDAKEQIKELKTQIDDLKAKIEELSKKPAENKAEIKKVEKQIETKEKKADWIMDQYNF